MSRVRARTLLAETSQCVGVGSASWDIPVCKVRAGLASWDIPVCRAMALTAVGHPRTDPHTPPSPNIPQNSIVKIN